MTFARNCEWGDHDDKLNGGAYEKDLKALNLDQVVAMFPKTNDQATLIQKIIENFDQHGETGPYGVQAAMGTKNEWIHWSLQLAKYHLQTKSVLEEYQKDISLHKETLDQLGDETYEGYQGSHDYIKALHCIFHDTFLRCDLPSPPLLNLDQAMVIRDDGAEYKSRMRSFSGYKFRAFGLVDVIAKHYENLDSTLNTNDQEVESCIKDSGKKDVDKSISDGEESSDEYDNFLLFLKPLTKRRAYKVKSKRNVWRSHSDYDDYGSYGSYGRNYDYKSYGSYRRYS